MGMLKRIDEKMMFYLTYSGRFPDWSKAPRNAILVYAVVFSLLGSILIATEWFAEETEMASIFLGATVLLIAFYHWRLWRRLKQTSV